MDIRNIAIIAHVDHGKTTITDGLLRQTGMLNDDTSMDSNDLEMERGITIYSKNTSLFYKDTKINILDTPGHADFGSEVERVLRSIDNVLLVVDAAEGPMPQTKFVLKKALELKHQPIVILNKIDKPGTRIDEVGEEIFELFLDLGANDEQLNFTTLLAIGKDGIAKKKLEDSSDNLFPILDTVLEKIPPIKANDNSTKAQIFNLAYDDFLGRLAICRIYDGKIQKNASLFLKDQESTRKSKIGKIFTFEGKNKKEIETAQNGDIVMIAGLDDPKIGETLCQEEHLQALEKIEIEKPTISLDFLVNDSPFSGREGSKVTSSQIRERLKKELEINVGLQVDFSGGDGFKVSGRGELHIAILLENMRREGFELAVSKPKVIFQETPEGRLEPFEELIIDVPTNMVGGIVEKLSKRKGRVVSMKKEPSFDRLIFEIPTRGFLGYRNEFIVDTKGEGILNSRFIGFKPYVGKIDSHQKGSMTSAETGKALGYSLDNLQKRGSLYIKASEEIYEGMVIGNTAKGDEMAVNPIKGKQLTNMRASGNDDAISLTPPIKINIEKGLEMIKDDEFLEITPKSVRLRKKFLKEVDRIKASRKEKQKK